MKEFRNLVVELKPRLTSQKVNKAYFEGVGGQQGFLWDFFTSLRELGLGQALNSIQPKLEVSGSLPTRTYLNSWTNLPQASLKELSRLNINLDGDHQGENANAAFKPLHKHFDNDSGHKTQRAEAGRFILLISEGCRLLLRMRQMLNDEGPLLLSDLSRSVQSLLKDNFSPHHHLHNQVQRCWDRLQTGVYQNILDMSDYDDFLNQLINDRKRHLAQMMIVLGRQNSKQKSGIQEVQLQLELQTYWSGMDNRGEAQGLKSHGEFRQHLHNFQETLLTRLKGMEAFLKRIEDEMSSGGSLNSSLSILLQTIHDLLGECSELNSTLSEGLSARVKKDQLSIKRLMNQVGNYQKAQQSEIEGWPPLALKRYRYLEMECIRTFFLSNEKEVYNMGRCIPHLFQAIQNDLAGTDLDHSNVLKKRLENLIGSTGRILKKH